MLEGLSHAVIWKSHGICIVIDALEVSLFGSCGDLSLHIPEINNHSGRLVFAHLFSICYQYRCSKG